MINWPGITSHACVNPLFSPALRAASRLWQTTSHQSVTVLWSPEIFEVTTSEKRQRCYFFSHILFSVPKYLFHAK